MTNKEILTMNLKYYRYKYNLSQEDFAKKVGSNLTYINQIENLRIKPTIDMVDKLADGMNNNIDKSLKITAPGLIKFDSKHKTNFTRVNKKK